MSLLHENNINIENNLLNNKKDYLGLMRSKLVLKQIKFSIYYNPKLNSHFNFTALINNLKNQILN